MISKKAKYALKALRVLAQNFENKASMTIAEIATEDNLPKRFLEAILLDLRRGGVLESTKGKNGGYYLKNHPSQTSLAKIIRLIDGPISPTLCVSLHFYGKCDDCDDEVTCKIRPIMMQIRDANLRVYEAMTLEDLK